jgi:hypothetical protein
LAFANHENSLVAIMADERKHIIELALRRILAARTIHANQHNNKIIINRRDGQIRSTVQSRGIMTKFNTKCEIKTK